MHTLTPPTFEPVTVDQARDALRIDDDRFDVVLPGLISAAREQAEQITGRQFVQQVKRTELPDWPAVDDVIHVYRPTTAAVSYWNGNAWVVLATNAYVYAPDAATGLGTSLAPALNTSWPTLGDVAIGPRVRVDLTAGQTTAVDTPPAVQTFIIALVGQMIQSPELSAKDAASPLLSGLLDPWRV
jgi:uncharacterized phiE125 gp8 family phage protein